MTTAFGRQLAIIRRGRGLSQAGLDALINPTGANRFVCQLESGHRRASPHVAARVARLLGVQPWRLLAPLIEDAQDAMCTRAERTMAVVGITAFALSLSESDWVELRRDPAKLAAAVEAWRDGNA